MSKFKFDLKRFLAFGECGYLLESLARNDVRFSATRAFIPLYALAGLVNDPLIFAAFVICGEFLGLQMCDPVARWEWPDNHHKFLASSLESLSFFLIAFMLLKDHVARFLPVLTLLCFVMQRSSASLLFRHRYERRSSNEFCNIY